MVIKYPHAAERPDSISTSYDPDGNLILTKYVGLGETQYTIDPSKFYVSEQQSGAGEYMLVMLAFDVKGKRVWPEVITST